jgi:hypothetical protein
MPARDRWIASASVPVARPGAQRPERLGDPRRQPRREVRRAQLVVALAARGDDVVGTRVDGLRRPAGGDEQVARDRGVRAARGLHRHAVERDTVDRAGGTAQRGGVLDRGALEQRAVDVPEEQERLQRSNARSAPSFWANAAISFALLWTSSSSTISTGECM